MFRQSVVSAMDINSASKRKTDAKNGLQDTSSDCVFSHTSESHHTRGGSLHSFDSSDRGLTTTTGSDTAALVLCDELDEQHGMEHDGPGPGGTLVDSSGPTHCHGPATVPDTLARNQLIIVSALCLFFMIAQIVGGVLSGSLALMTDATHMGCDLAGFLVSLGAIWLAKRKATVRLSFGYHRAEVVGAFISVLLIWVVTGVLVYLAIQRVHHQQYEIAANDMLLVASLGVFFNIVMGIVLHSGLCRKCNVHTNFGHGHSHGPHGHSHHPLNGMHNADLVACETSSLDSDNLPQADIVTPQQNINVKAAMVHVIGDLIQSVGVLVAAVIIKVEPSYKLADPICTFVFSILVLITTFLVLRDVFLIFMEAVPKDLDFHSMRKDLERVDGVKMVHSLNVWALTVDKVVVAVHLVIDPGNDPKKILERATKLLRSAYYVHHSTIQVEEYEPIMDTCIQCNNPV